MSLIERLRNCSSCAERRRLMRQYADQMGDVVRHQFERARSAANIAALRAQRRGPQRKP